MSRLEDESLARLIEPMVDGYLRLDARGRCRLANPAVAAMLGTSVASLNGRAIHAWCDPADWEALTHALAQRGGALSAYPLRVEPGGQAGRLWSVSAHRGQVEGEDYIDCVVREAGQDTLTDLEAPDTLTRIFDHLPDIYYRTDAEGLTQVVSQAVVSFLGYRPEELIGRPLTDLYVDPSIREQLLARLQQEGGRIYGFENRLKHKDGSVVWGMASSQFVYDAQGQVIGVEGIVKDITPAKTLEATLQQAQQQLSEQLAFREALIESLPNPIFWIDADRQLRLCNAELRQLFHDPLAEWEGVALTTLLEPSLSEVLAQVLPQSLGREIGHDVEAQWQLGGETRDLLIRLQGVTLEGEHGAGVLGVVHDISAIRNAQREREQVMETLRQAQKMESIGKLAAGVAHNFNNILATVLGYAELARLQLDEHQAETDTYLGHICDASLRARDLVGQLLVYTKERRSEPVHADVPLLLEDLQRFAREVLPASVALRVEGPQTLPEVAMDPASLRQVLVNLLVNARDAMDGQGAIQVRAEHATETGQRCHSCREEFSGPFVLLELADDGSGIEAHHLPHLFDPFFTTKEIGEGVGLGLSVVHGVVHQIGGHIQVRSAPGEGARFRVYLPIARSRAAGASRPALDERARPATGFRVLVVDDEPMVASLYEKILQRAGGEVQVCHNGATALALVESDPTGIDLLITDQAMPRMSGDALIEAIQQLRSDLPIILNTGYSPTAESDGERKPGVVASLGKPVSARRLLAAVARALNPDVPKVD